MIKRFSKTIIFFALAAILFLPNFVFAEDLATSCSQVVNNNLTCQNMTGTDCRALLEKCAAFYEQESIRIGEDITKTEKEKKTLQNQVATLKKKVQNLEYQINQGTMVIKDLAIQIGDTQSSIVKISLQIEESKDQISSILRSMDQEDQKSQVEILLEGDLSDFFNNLTYLQNLNSKLRELLKSTQDLKSYLEGQKIKMDDEKDQTERTVKLQTQQKKENELNKKEQETLLKLTEAEYQKQLRDKEEAEKKTAAIKAKLFQIIGVSKAPTFGEAIEVAKSAAAIAGIRPALLLAVISQESAIGRNVGQCVLVDAQTGQGKRIKTGALVSKLMKPSRDVSPFLTITKDLGRDPYNTAVSCPLSVGYGGAMGPAQFIPSTWRLYADKIRNVTGSASDPWSIRDSFIAAGLYLADLGASAKTATKESNAASRYYGGSSSYASSVMRRAKCIQSFIDTGEMSTTCQNLIL
ncbi:MAG: lytic murein transglycosylase [Candidatus Staskawiczbacteria bacterium]|jgi:membrane-bound lytic murein transglycosylase B